MTLTRKRSVDKRKSASYPKPQTIHLQPTTATHLIQGKLLRISIRSNHRSTRRLRPHSTQSIRQSIACRSHHQLKRRPCKQPSPVYSQTISPRHTNADIIRKTSETTAFLCCRRASLMPIRKPTRVYARANKTHSVACYIVRHVILQMEATKLTMTASPEMPMAKRMRPAQVDQRVRWERQELALRRHS